MSGLRGWIAAVGLLLFASGASSAFASTLDLDDVIRLHAAGVSDDIIMSETIVTESVFSLTADDILRLHEAGFSERLMQFLVDTGRAGESEESAPVDEASTDDEGETYAEIEDEGDDVDEDESTTRVYVSLNYRSSSWWYDRFWWDYWYYDSFYSPYYFSNCGGWGWSSAGYWNSPCSSYCGNFDPWWNANSCSSTNYWSSDSRRRFGPLSDAKWKTNQFASGSSYKSKGVMLHTDLASHDVSGDLKIGRPFDGKHASDRLVIAGTKSRGDVVHPIRTPHPTRVVKSNAVVKHDVRADPRVRRPASGPKPVKFVKPVTSPTTKPAPEVVKPRKPDGDRAVDIKPTPTKPTPVKPAPVKPSPTKSKSSSVAPRSPRLHSAPAHRAPSSRSAPAPRSAPSSKPAPSAPSKRGGR